MPQPRRHKDNADRQRAYRNRKRNALRLDVYLHRLSPRVTALNANWHLHISADGRELELSGLKLRGKDAPAAWMTPESCEEWLDGMEQGKWHN